MRKYSVIKQNDITDCGAACIAMISKAYKCSLSISKIRQIAGTDKIGTNVYGMVKALDELGFSAKAVKGDSESLDSDFPLPCIAHVITEKGFLHYVVIYKIDKKRDRVIYGDPAEGLIKLDKEEFLKLWTGYLVLAVPSNRFEKGDKTKSVLSRFIMLLKPQRYLLFNIFLASLIFTFAGIAASFYYKILMDDIIPNSLIETLKVVSIGFILLYTFQILLNIFRSHLVLYLAQRLDIALILGFYEKVLSLPIEFFGTRKVGEIVSRFMDASKIRDALAQSSIVIMIDSIMVVAGAIVLYIQNASLFVIAGIIAILYIIIVWAFHKPYKYNQKMIMENSAMLNAFLVESLEGVEMVKSFNIENQANMEIENRFIKVLKMVFKDGILQNIQINLKGYIQAVGGLIILWSGSVQVIQGTMTLGELLTFNALLAYFLNPIKNLVDLQIVIQSAVVSAERIIEILDLEPEMNDDEKKKISPSYLNGDIKMNHIDFRYGTRQLVLSNVDFKVRRGEKIAIVGESGSGKSTLAKLILNFYDVEGGEILLDGNNIKDINKEVLRKQIGYIPQEIFLFSGTIEDNLRLGNEKITLEEMIEVCKQMSIHEFISSLPLRYQSILTENGSNLSGGQRQRLALARAFIKKPDILIMDEATSNLDTSTERMIQNLIRKEYENITMIIIAHRLSTIRLCDRIYVFDKGTVAEEGTHEQLLRKNGKYADLWKDQLLEMEIG